MRAGFVRRLGLLVVAILSSTVNASASVPGPQLSAICTGSTFASGGSVSGAIAGGQLLMWGVGAVGQLGQGGFGLHPTPGPISNLTGLTAVNGVYLGSQDSFGIDSSGNVWGWGSNVFFTLGRATPQFATFPQRITGPTNVVDVAAGSMHTLALTGDGSVWGWGFSTAGELNFTSPFPQVTPQPINGITGVAKIAAGNADSLLLMGDGTVLGGGDNSSGQLGFGFFAREPLTTIPGLSNIVDVALSPEGGDQYMLAVDASGHVYFSGSYLRGELGDGTTSVTPQRTVMEVPGVNNVFAVAAGATHVLALRLDGTVLAWGSNTDGQLGNGSVGGIDATPTVVHFQVPVHIVAIAAGAFTSMALDDQGHVWTWGDNSAGQMTEDPPPSGSVRNEPSPIEIGNIAAVSAPCAPPQRSYIPSHDGYSFNNSMPDPPGFIPPVYEKMPDYYPASADRMFTSDGHHTNVGQLFYDEMFAPAYKDGLCYGMASSDTFLYNRSAVHPETFSRWLSFDAPFNPNTLAPPLASSDATIQAFIERFHSRQYGALGSATSAAVWQHYGFDVGPSLNPTNGNLDAFNDIAARVQTAPEVVAFGPSPFIATSDPQRWWRLFNDASHAVVAYGTDIAPDGTRLIHVYDPSSVFDSGDRLVTDLSDIRVAPDGGVQLVDFGGGATGSPQPWLGGGIVGGKDAGGPHDWILMPLPDHAFSESQVVVGQDNRHWVVDDAIALLLLESNGPITFPNGTPIFHFSGPAPDGLAMELPPGAGYDGSVLADGAGASSSMTIHGHVVTATQTDANATGSSHHVVIDPAALSIGLDSATQVETFNLEIAADFLPAYTRQVSMSGVALAPGQVLNFASDTQTSGLMLSGSGPSQLIATTFEQDGANAGHATVQVTMPANGQTASVVVFDWNGLGTSLIYEVIDAQGTPSGQVLQANPAEQAAQVASDLAGMQSAIAGIANAGLRTSLLAKVASAQDSLSRGQVQAAAGAISALRNQVDAQAGKGIDATTITRLNALSADALVLLS